MALEQRRYGQYYYRKQWRNGTCVSEYVGSGVLGQYASIVDDQERTERAMQRLELRNFIQAQRDIDQLLDEYNKQVMQVVGEILQLLGYHQHKRQWRRIRKMAEKTTQTDVLALRDEYRDLYDTARQPKATKQQIEELRLFVRSHPEILYGLDKLSLTAVDSMVDSIGEMPLATKIQINGELKALENSLGYLTATPMEKLLIRNISMCWFRMHIAEMHYDEKGKGFASALYREKQLSATQRRYLRAIEALARVRGLLTRAGIQLNVAQQMVVQNG